MQGLSSLLPYIQIILAVLLVTGILLQRSESGLGGAFGGTGEFGASHVRRGFERTLFQATIIIAILFAIAIFIPRIL